MSERFFALLGCEQRSILKHHRCVRIVTWARACYISSYELLLPERCVRLVFALTAVSTAVLPIASTALFCTKLQRA